MTISDRITQQELTDYPPKQISFDPFRFGLIPLTMPRHARLDAEGVLRHIIVRGIERRLIFRDDSDKNRFVERMGNSWSACFKGKV